MTPAEKVNRWWLVGLTIAVVAMLVGPCVGKFDGKITIPLPWTPSPVVPATGPREIRIVRESEKDTTAVGGLLTKLQSSDKDFRAYIAEKKHILLVFDDDATDERDRPLEILKAEAPYKETGEVLIYAAGKLISRDPLPADVAGLKALIQKAGG